MRGLRIFRSRIFWKLYASMSAVLLATAVLVGALVDQRLERSLLDSLEATLTDECLLFSPLARRAFRANENPDLQEELFGLGPRSGKRVTLIRPDGIVVGDTDEHPTRMEDHGGRPEIVAASAAEFGVSHRFSRTVGEEMLYVARELNENGKPLGYVRVAMPLRVVDAQLAAATRSVVLGTAAGFLLMLLLGLIVARQFTVPIAAMTRAAEELRNGNYDYRVRWDPRDEFGLLADTLNRLGAEVTERVATISQEDAQLRAILAGMVEGVVAVDQDDAVSFCNQAARDVLEIQRGDVQGRRLWELAPVRDLEALLEQARAGRAPASGEIELFRGEKERVIDVHASPFRGGGRRGVVLVMNDVTELRRLERVRRDFVANVSHELKTPLTSIKGFVETLLSGALHDPENNERFLKRIDANVERLNHLVSDLLSLARIESQVEAHHDEVAWRPVLDEVCRRNEEAARRRGVALEVSVEEDVVVLGDREAMVQVLENLLNNAIKYTPGPGSVRVRLSRLDGRGVLEVEDTGIGIPPRDLDRIFERFYRVDKARSREVGGTGLGLSIVRNLVRKMEGDVRVQSEEGRGTRFTVELPLVQRSGSATARS